MSTFTLSIETDRGTYVHGYHLGTDEGIARTFDVEIFAHRFPRQGTYIRTVALMRDGKVFDVFDGKWASVQPKY